MAEFLGRDFLLSTDTAKKLYHDHAAKMPIVDYHCHVSPREIFEDRRFENITQAWLSGDHYKWRLMRANGVPEEYVTGDAPDREKFQKFAETLPRAIGNPMLHWCHLELRNYFGYEGVLNGATAQEVWDLTSAKLQEPGMGVRGLIEKSNVAFIGTTDDPTDSLEWHEKLAGDPSFSTVTAPSFRPDKALNMEKPGWLDFVHRLARTAGVDVTGIDSLEAALWNRMEYFNNHGCRASDHGLDYMVFRPADRGEVDGVVKKGLAGEHVSLEDAEKVKTALLLFCAGRYSELDWVMQIHYNCMRNPNTAMFEAIGPDTGYDCIGPHNGGPALRSFLDALYRADTLPRTIVYSLDGGDNAFLDALLGSFQGGGRGRLQHGAAWWFNDTKSGMTEQLTSFANLGLLGNFVGMLTDSRSFLSYARHEYFRRILCGLVGGWAENGEVSGDMAYLGGLVEDVSYNNAARYFRLQ